MTKESEWTKKRMEAAKCLAIMSSRDILTLIRVSKDAGETETVDMLLRAYANACERELDWALGKRTKL